MHISEEINNIIGTRDVFVLRLFGLEIGIRDSVIAMWVITIVLVIIVRLLTGKLKDMPDGKQNFIETIVEGLEKFVRGNSEGIDTAAITPFIGTIFIYLIFMNIGGIFSIIPDPKELYEIFKWDFLLRIPVIRIFPPTKDINVTFGLAAVTMVMIFYKTMKIKKLKKGLHTFVEPVALMLPFKLLDYVVRPLSLTLRMFGNVMAAFIMMELIYFAFPLIVPGMLSLYFDIFDGVLQALIFTFLTTMYMSEALE